MSSRRPLSLVSFAGLAVLAFGLVACPSKDEEKKDPGTTQTPSTGDPTGATASGTGTGGTTGTPAGEEAPKPPPTMESLHPVIRESGEEGVVPTAITVELSEPVADMAKQLGKSTVLKITPETAGAFTWSSPSTLVFTPKDPLAPDTSYSAVLESVETKYGTVAAASSGQFERAFTTPKFKLARASFAAFDPQRNRLEAELVFSAPVDVSSIKENATWSVNGFPVGKSIYERTDRKNVARATLTDKRIDFGANVTLALDAGVKFASNKSITAPAGSGEIKVNEGEPITIHAGYLQEGANGFYVAIICKDEGAGKDQQYYWDNVVNQSFYVSKRCALEESDALDSVHFNPPVKFTVSPMRGGFRLLGNFARGSYSLRIDANARSMDGGVLKKPYSLSFSVPARKPQLSFVSQGRYLPKSAWQNLAIRHMNVSKADLTIRHIPTENLVFWMSAEQETADDRTSNVVLKKQIPLKGDADALVTSWVDVGMMLPSIPRGVVELLLTTEGAEAKARLMITDINLIAKQEGDAGKVWVWALDMHENRPIAGVTVKQIVKSGRTISTCNTDRLGGCVLEGLDAKAIELDPSPPFALIAQREGDITYLKFEELRTEIADSLVHGRPFNAESPYRAAMYSDRGVYRPGETVHVAAILRGKDDAAPPEGMPVEMKLIDPKGKVARKMVKKANAAGVLSADLKFDDFADTGSWQVTLEAGKRQIASYGFNIEEFVPERMKVTAKAEKPEFLISEAVPVEVSAQYLFGGSASGSRVEMSCELRPAQFSPKNNAGYEYGMWRPEEKPPAPLAIGNATGELGEEGKSKLTCPSLTQRGSFAGTARLAAKVAVFEAGSGRTTQGDATALVHPEAYYIGLASGTKKVKAGEAFAVEGVLVDWTGAFTKEAGEVELELFRVENEHDWIYEDEAGRWSYRHYTRLASDGKLPKPAVKDGKFTVLVTAGTDGAAFVVRAKSGRAQTDLRIEGSQPYWWWWSSENGRDETPRPMKPASVEMTTPEVTKVGEKTKISFVSPFKGRALVSVESDKVIVHEWIDVNPGTTEWSFKLPDFAPNVYASVFVVKDPHQDSKESFLPSRAFGVSSIRVDPEPFRHVMKLEVPSEIRSNAKLEVKLDFGKLDEPAVVTVAAVDEGILSLTKFQTPDPLEMIFDRRALGISTYETIGWNLLLPAGGNSRSEGGDEDGGGAGRVQPVKPVALWSGVVEVPASGKVTVTFDVPQYRGSLRVMVVSAGKKKMGSASANVLVRDPLVLQTTLPRFLTFGDNAEVPVFVTNMSGAPQKVEVSLTAEPLPVPGMVELEKLDSKDVIQVKGGAVKQLDLAKDASGTAIFRIKSLQAVGAAKLRVKVQAGELASTEELDVPFTPAAPKTREVQKIELSEGTTDLKPYLKGWVATTERSTVWVTSNPFGESFDHLKYLIHYPYGCVEQTTSSTRPLLFVSNFVANVDPALVARERIEDMVMAGVNRILSMQTAAGGFAYWPGETEATPWGTAYATHLLLDAQKLRYPVPEERVKDALEWIERELTTRYEAGKIDKHDWWYWRDAEPYMQFVLATAGRGRKARIEKLIEQLRPKAKSSSEESEQVYMLKAALYLAGDHRFEADLKNPDVSAVANTRENSWTFYSDRRRRGFMLSTFTDLFGDDPAGEKLANVVAESLRGHTSYWYTTQEMVWGITGLGKRIGASAKAFTPGVLIANGKELKPEGQAAGAKSSDRSWAVARASEYKELAVRVDKVEGGKLYLILSSEGVKENATYKVGGEGLKIKREYRQLDGEPINLSDGSVKLGEMIYASLAITNSTGDRVENIALVDRFPAGWEIENPRLGRGGTSMSWIEQEELWPARYMNLRDDRIELFGSLESGQTKKVVYALRAVTAGHFAVPPVEAEAMYYPDFWAREAGGRAVITGPWESSE